jgi:hypothetical protein
MLKTIIVAAIAGLPLLFVAAEVRAKSMGVNGIECPVGTCGGDGGPKSRDAKFCKPSNCKKGLGASK